MTTEHEYRPARTMCRLCGEWVSHDDRATHVCPAPRPAPDAPNSQPTPNHSQPGSSEPDAPLCDLCKLPMESTDGHGYGECVEIPDGMLPDAPARAGAEGDEDTMPGGGPSVVRDRLISLDAHNRRVAEICEGWAAKYEAERARADAAAARVAELLPRARAAEKWEREAMEHAEVLTSKLAEAERQRDEAREELALADAAVAEQRTALAEARAALREVRDTLNRAGYGVRDEAGTLVPAVVAARTILDRALAAPGAGEPGEPPPAFTQEHMAYMLAHADRLVPDRTHACVTGRCMRCRGVTRYSADTHCDACALDVAGEIGLRIAARLPEAPPAAGGRT